MNTAGRRSGTEAVVVGAGAVGARCVRELLGAAPAGTPTVDAVTLVGRRVDRLANLSGAFGPAVRTRTETRGDPTPFDDVDVVVVTREAGEQLDVAERALRAGAHVVSTSDSLDEVRALLALDGLAREAGRSLIVGAAMAPGLSCLLARHGAGLLDSVDEVHIARAGAGGPACARQRRRALRGPAVEWRDGAYVERPGFSGRELVWFPDPTAGADCYRAGLADPLLLVDAFPQLRRASARLAASRVDRVTVALPMLVGPPVEGAPGAIRVEVRGTRDGERHDVVYGAFDRPSVATAAVAAVAAGFAVAGRLPVGATGLAGVGDPLPILHELARRGIRAATFEGSREFGVIDTSTDRSI